MWRHTDIWVYEHMGVCADVWAYRYPQTYKQSDITPTCLPATPERICKRDMAGKKPRNMPECTHINTDPNYPTK